MEWRDDYNRSKNGQFVIFTAIIGLRHSIIIAMKLKKQRRYIYIENYVILTFTIWPVCVSL